MTLLVSVVFTACGGGLTDAQLVWCSQPQNIGSVKRAADTLGIEQRDFDLYARIPSSALVKSSEFVRACKAAYESR